MIDMGGLKKYLPVTHLTFLIACLAIAGIPPFAGFFSKDEILAAAYSAQPLYFVSGTLVAGLTAFYMFRLYFRVFWHQDPGYNKQPVEAPATMTIPLIVLALGAVLAGLIPFSHYVTSDGIPFDTHFHWNVAIISTLVAVAGIGVAAMLYARKSALPEKIIASFKGIYTLIDNKFYIDEIYIFITKNIIFKYISAPLAWFDRHIVDGFMNWVATITNWFSTQIKGMQSGQLQQYLFVFLSGIIILALAFLYLITS